MKEDRTPILIGAGQYVQRDSNLVAALEPVDMMAECARRAAADAGADDRLLAKLDSVAVINIVCWQYRNPPRLLASRIGAQPREELYTLMGGDTPQWLVNETAAKIAAGQVRLALLAGAEAFHTMRLAHKNGVRLAWTQDDFPPPALIGIGRAGSTEHEMAHHLRVPTQVFPLFENALRAKRRLSIPEHRESLAELCSRLSAVAAENPYAWFRRARSAAEIGTVSPENRMIGFPYPKYMNAIMDVDQAAALIMTSVAEAEALGIDRSRWVYLRGAAAAHDLWFISERLNYYSSPAIRRAGEKALAMAGVGIGDIDYFDLYSCFPCAVQITADMLGIRAGDPRPLTVTGGLPYHGGPGSNYSSHAIATMMAKLREKPGTIGLVSALGWYVTKHAIGIYATEPGPRPWVREDPQRYQADLDTMPHPNLVTAPQGRGTIETYTVLHDRDGRPETGIVVGRLEDGRRFLANTPNDLTLLEDLMKEEGVGRRGRVSSAGTNLFVPD